MIKSGIYKIVCVIDGKCYVGSSENLGKRKREHFNDLRKNKHDNQHLQHAFNKYGEENFIFVVIEYCDINVLLDREQYYIDTLHVCDRKYGYNIQPIAGRPSITEEIRTKMSQIHKGLQTGEKHPFWGKHHLEESKIKISQNHADVSGKNNPRARKIIRLSDGKTYECMKDCVKENKISHSTICRHCQNKVQHPKFQYY